MRRSPDPGIHTGPAGLWVWETVMPVSVDTDPCGQWPWEGGAVMSPRAHMTMPEDCLVGRTQEGCSGRDQRQLKTLDNTRGSAMTGLHNPTCL